MAAPHTDNFLCSFEIVFQDAIPAISTFLVPEDGDCTRGDYEACLELQG
jgi:hypothetical protein